MRFSNYEHQTLVINEIQYKLVFFTIGKTFSYFLYFSVHRSRWRASAGPGRNAIATGGSRPRARRADSPARSASRQTPRCGRHASRASPWRKASRARRDDPSPGGLDRR